MTSTAPAPITAPAPPADGDTREWWSIDGDVRDLPGCIYRYRATYHANTPWSRHPWAAAVAREGAAFVNTWSIERWSDRYGWDAAGRSYDDPVTHTVNHRPVFATRAAALAKAADMLYIRIHQASLTLTALRAAVAAVEAERAALSGGGGRG